MSKILMSVLLALTCGTLTMAQTDETEVTEPNYDEIVAYLTLSDANLACLENNQTAFQEAAEPSIETIRDLKRQVREAAQAGEDTTALVAQIEAEQAAVTALRANYVTSAKACLSAEQQSALGAVVAAETLMNEVRQSIRLLLVQPTEEKAEIGGGRKRGGKKGGGRGGAPAGQ